VKLESKAFFQKSKIYGYANITEHQVLEIHHRSPHTNLWPLYFDSRMVAWNR